MKIRLHQFLRETGVFESKQNALNAIINGEITISNKAIKNPNFQFNARKKLVCWKGKPLKQIKKKIYIILNKPEGYLSSRLTKQDIGKKSVFDIVKGAADENTEKSLYCIGRLDEDTSGLLIITNDGQLEPKINSPEANIKKTYRAVLQKPISKEDILKIERGITITLEQNGKYSKYTTKPCKIALIDSKKLDITISEGKKREVKRIFEAVGNKVIKLQRIRIGDLRLEELKIKKGKYILVNRDFIYQKILKKAKF